jgi:hypothetical protein
LVLLVIKCAARLLTLLHICCTVLQSVMERDTPCATVFTNDVVYSHNIYWIYRNGT